MSNKNTLGRIAGLTKAYFGDPHRYEKEMKKLVKEGKDTGDIFLLGCAYRELAVAYALLGKRDDILKCSAKAVALLKDSNEHEIVAKAYGTLGYAYFAQENFQMALANYDRAYHIQKKHRIRGKNTLGMLNNIATCYAVMGDRKMCIRLLNECIERAKTEDPGNYTSLYGYHANIADCLELEEDYGKACEVLASMSDWIEKVQIQNMVHDYHIRRAIALYLNGDESEGNRWFDSSLDLIEKNGIPKDLYDEQVLFDCFRKVLRILVKKKDRERAKRIVVLMEEYNEKRTDSIDRLIFYRALSDYYGGFGDFEKAAIYYAKLDELYEERLDELRSIQLNVHRMIRGADSEIQRLTDKISKDAVKLSREPLTQLLNRTALLHVSSEFIELAKAKKETVGAIFIDIDYFKQCNDSYGHAFGDNIIKEVAQACRKEEKTTIRFARYGGDEFFGLARGLKDEDLIEIAKRICNRIKELNIPNESNPNEHRVTLSVGIANVTVTEHTNTLIDIANFADKALYHAKDTGRNAIYFLDHSRSSEKDKDAIFVRIDF